MVPALALASNEEQLMGDGIGVAEDNSGDFEGEGNPQGDSQGDPQGGPLGSPAINPDPLEGEATEFNAGDAAAGLNAPNGGAEFLNFPPFAAPGFSPEGINGDGMGLPMDIAPTSIELNNHRLQINVADEAGNWIEVDNLLPIPKAINWDFSAVSSTKQIQVIANFPPYVATVNREVEIQIPAGYRILEMTGPSSWTPPAGITKLAPSDISKDDAMFTSVSLTGLSGGTWPQAFPIGQIPPATNYYAASVSADWIRGGTVKYTFAPGCEYIILTLTLAVEQAILPHADGTSTLRPINAILRGNEILTETLTTTVTNLAIPRGLGGTLQTATCGGSRPVGGVLDASDDTKGTVPEFSTGHSYWSAGYSDQPHWVENAMFTVTYPEGVTLTGFADKAVLGASTSNKETRKVDVGAFTPVGGLEVYTIPNGNGVGHLTVTHDPIARTVTFDYINVYLPHDSSNGSFWLFWTAEVDNNNIKWGDKLNFPATFTETGGTLVGDPKTLTIPSASGTTITIEVKKPVDGFPIVVKEQARVRRDLNAYADGNYPYDYALGQFQIYNNSPFNYTGTLVYEFTFDPSLAVRALTLPGYVGNNFSNLVAKVSNSAGVERTISIPDIFTVTNTSEYGAGRAYTPAVLGLAEDEYILEFKIEQTGLAGAVTSNSYVTHATTYYGRWQGGQEGDATVVVYDKDRYPSESEFTTGTHTSHTTINWTQAGAGYSYLYYYSDPSFTVRPSGGSFNPTDTIYFQASIITEVVWRGHSNDIVDPIICISLPYGIDLDMDSVQGSSISGNHRDNGYYDLRYLDSSNWTDSEGNEWTLYRFTSANKLDLIARAASNSVQPQPTNYNNIYVRFSATASGACKTYTNLLATDIVVWDLGQTAVTTNASTPDFVLIDTRNRLGKGSGYVVVAPESLHSIPLNIVQKTGLNVSVGIRVEGDTGPFYTYSGVPTSIAAVSVD